MGEIQSSQQPASIDRSPLEHSERNPEISVVDGAQFAINGVNFSIKKKSPRDPESQWVISLSGVDDDGEPFENLVTKDQVQEVSAWVNEAMDFAKKGKNAMDIHFRMATK